MKRFYKVYVYTPYFVWGGISYSADEAYTIFGAKTYKEFGMKLCKDVKDRVITHWNDLGEYNNVHWLKNKYKTIEDLYKDCRVEVCCKVFTPFWNIRHNEPLSFRYHKKILQL